MAGPGRGSPGMVSGATGSRWCLAPDARAGRAGRADLPSGSPAPGCRCSTTARRSWPSPRRPTSAPRGVSPRGGPTVRARFHHAIDRQVVPPRAQSRRTVLERLDRAPGRPGDTNCSSRRAATGPSLTWTTCVVPRGRRPAWPRLAAARSGSPMGRARPTRGSSRPSRSGTPSASRPVRIPWWEAPDPPSSRRPTSTVPARPVRGRTAGGRAPGPAAAWRSPTSGISSAAWSGRSCGPSITAPSPSCGGPSPTRSTTCTTARRCAARSAGLDGRPAARAPARRGSRSGSAWAACSCGRPGRARHPARFDAVVHRRARRCPSVYRVRRPHQPAAHLTAAEPLPAVAQRVGPRRLHVVPRARHIFGADARIVDRLVQDPRLRFPDDHSNYFADRAVYDAIEAQLEAWSIRSADAASTILAVVASPRRIGILTAGGDSPGLNAAIRGFGKAAWATTAWRWSGSATGSAAWPTTTASGSTAGPGRHPHGRRDDPRHQPRQAAPRCSSTAQVRDMTPRDRRDLPAAHLDALVCLGGGGTQKNALRLVQAGLNVVTLPKTIDNDVARRTPPSASPRPWRSRPRRSTGCTARPTATTASSSPRSWGTGPAGWRSARGSPAAPT